MLPGLFLLPKRGVKVSLVVIFCSKRFSGDDICVYIYTYASRHELPEKMYKDVCLICILYIICPRGWLFPIYKFHYNS